MTSDKLHQAFDTILILDFGSQYSHLITRRVRELGVYCEFAACTQKVSELDFKPAGIILSGGPYSVYDPEAPHVDPAIWELGVPILGICYGLQEIAWHLGGKVAACQHREYGHATVNLVVDHKCPLFDGFADNVLQVWMSHGDQLSELPAGFQTVAHTLTSPMTAVYSQQKQIYGIQFHPEVTHTPRGVDLLRNFVIGVCKVKADWSMGSFIDKEIERIRAIVGNEAQVIGAVSGGVDSTVAAALMKQAIGDRFHAILVDNGLMRLNEAQLVKSLLGDKLGINLNVVDASSRFLGLLKGVTDPEQKRKIIGNTFIHVFEEEAERLTKEALLATTKGGQYEYLLQGTLYPDVIESISFKGPSATIKTHHNVGGLLADMKLKLIEPLRELFKDEVRQLGQVLGIDKDLVWRHPFPGPALAIRILGEVNEQQLEILRQVDDIYITELKSAGLYQKIAQAFAVLLPVKSVGVMGDSRTYEQVVALRAVESVDFMTADWFEMPYDFLKRVSGRIINEVKGVNRVVYDVSSKPPATIEWE
ncbi:hypothetical protein MIR68_003658 [Amoeboaphelidium protococcarum]|nr:hypothetical protein MIR68_003658 [Amoeboaphelidium protococcarum]